jgi:hypothetical protein
MFVAESQVVLDELCLQSCVQQQSLQERKKFEQLNHHAANLARLVCITDKVSLIIKSGVYSNSFRVTVAEKYGLLSRNSFDSALQHHVSKDFLEKMLLHIFERFKYFHFIELNLLHEAMGFVTDTILTIMSTEFHRSEIISGLRFSFSRQDVLDWRLIDEFSPQLKHIFIELKQRQCAPITADLWTKLRECKLLKKFTFLTDSNFHSEYGYSEPMLECMKACNLTHFVSDAKFITIYWLLAAFNRSNSRQRLRHLFTMKKHEDSNMHLPIRWNSQLASKQAQPLISRLRTIGLYFSEFQSPQDQANEIQAILQSLRKYRCLIAAQELQYPDLFTSIKTALGFWLTVSHQTGKSIKLNFTLFEKQTNSFVNSVILELSKMETFGDLIVSHCKNNRFVVLKLEKATANVRLSVKCVERYTNARIEWITWSSTN